MAKAISSALIRDEEDEKALPKLRGISYDSIYLVDNRKATFIFSSIKTAQSQYPGVRVKFLFPHTGLNNISEDLVLYGEILPIQYVNTSLLPVVIELGNLVKILIFCDDEFDTEYLKRVIWFAHKISGLASEIEIFFNNYDATRDEANANRIKSYFQASSLTAKIKIKSINYFNFVALKEDKTDTQLLYNNDGQRILEKKKLPISDDLDKILPFGEMIKPIIASTILSETDIKPFLIKKGVYIGHKEKQSTVPLLSTLLLSPRELNDLKYLLRSKEDRIKSVPRKTTLGENRLEINELANIVNDVINSSKDISPPKNCTVFKKPEIKIDKDEIIVSFVLEKQNTTKDLITGKQHNNGSVSFKSTKDGMDGEINYTTPEVYTYANKIFKDIEKSLLHRKVIAEEFHSIKFNSFDNLKRINFFLNFMNMSGENIFKDASLQHIVVKPDSSSDEELPFDLESLKNKVNELAISGKELDSVHYFNDNYKKVLLMQRVKIKYDYTHGIEKGQCIVDLNFKNAFSTGDENAELHFDFDIIKSSTNKGKDLEKLEHQLKKSFKDIIQKRYRDKFLNT